MLHVLMEYASRASSRYGALAVAGLLAACGQQAAEVSGFETAQAAPDAERSAGESGRILDRLTAREASEGSSAAAARGPAAMPHPPEPGASVSDIGMSSADPSTTVIGISGESDAINSRDNPPGRPSTSAPTASGDPDGTLADILVRWWEPSRIAASHSQTVPGRLTVVDVCVEERAMRPVGGPPDRDPAHAPPEPGSSPVFVHAQHVVDQRSEGLAVDAPFVIGRFAGFSSCVDSIRR